MVLKISGVAALLFLACLSFAHQPRLVGITNQTVEISNPEVSQAFYGELNGSPASYQIKSGEPFAFYAGILVPDIPGVGKDVSALVSKSEGSAQKRIFLLDSAKANWSYFYEEFAGDGYYQGPEARESLDGGAYNITVFSSGNKGKYVLVVGEKEELPPGEIIHTLVTLPFLKMYFGKSPLLAYFNSIGMYALAVLALAAAVPIVFYYSYKLIRRIEVKRE